jgi:hypothetical protein
MLSWISNYYSKAQLPTPKSIATNKAKDLINTVEIIFPEVSHVLYIWHVNNDVKAYCRKLWKREIKSIKNHTTAEERHTFIEKKWSDLKARWLAIIQAPSEVEFNARWEELSLQYWDKYPEIISYLADN